MPPVLRRLLVAEASCFLLAALALLLFSLSTRAGLSFQLWAAQGQMLGRVLGDPHFSPYALAYLVYLVFVPALSLLDALSRRSNVVLVTLGGGAVAFALLQSAFWALQSRLPLGGREEFLLIGLSALGLSWIIVCTIAAWLVALLRRTKATPG